MIKFHYFTWPRPEMRKRGLLVGPGNDLVRCCHVWSDLPDPPAARNELLAWAGEHDIPTRWLQTTKQEFWHFDFWGKELAHCGEDGGTKKLRDHLAYLRKRAEGRMHTIEPGMIGGLRPGQPEAGHE